MGIGRKPVKHWLHYDHRVSQQLDNRPSLYVVLLFPTFCGDRCKMVLVYMEYITNIHLAFKYLIKRTLASSCDLPRA